MKLYDIYIYIYVCIGLSIGFVFIYIYIKLNMKYILRLIPSWTLFLIPNVKGVVCTMVNWMSQSMPMLTTLVFMNCTY